MTELKVIQNSVGSYNLLNPSEKSLSFSMGIYRDGALVEENKVKAKIYYSGDPDEKYEFDDPFGDLENVFEKCFSYADKVWGTTDYRAECLLFGKLYCEHYDEINSNLLAKHKERVQKKIESLQKELEWNQIVPDLSWSVNECVNKRIRLLTKWIESDIQSQSQIIPGTEKHTEIQKTIDRRNAEIEKLQQSKIKEEI